MAHLQEISENIYEQTLADYPIDANDRGSSCQGSLRIGARASGRLGIFVDMRKGVWVLCVSVIFSQRKTTESKMSARPVVKTSYMSAQMQEFAIVTAQVIDISPFLSPPFSSLVWSLLYLLRKRLRTSQQNKKLHLQSNKNLNNNTLQCMPSSLFPNIFLRLIAPFPPSRWHCFIGRNFGCFVTHEASKFIYFYVGQMGICLFATA